MLVTGLISNTATAQTVAEIVDRPPVGVYRAPLHGGCLKKLPVGQVQPQGWLREVLRRQSQGLCGQLGTVSAWLDKRNNQWLSDIGDHGWEEVPYWLRGYASMAYILNEDMMKQEAQVWFDAVLNHQKRDGFLGPKNMSNGRPEVWAQMVMLWALQTYYEYSGDERVPKAMSNYFRWEMKVPDDQFLESYWENKRGGDNEWSVVWLYNLTGDKTLLPLIEKLHRNTCNWTLKGDLPNWHGVNVAQGFREPATYYIYNGNEQMLQAAYDNHAEMRRRYGQVPGGMYGADENARPGYNDPRQGAETCAVVEQMASDEIMMGITGDPSWADHLEDVAFNTLPATMMPDLRALRYITSPNMAVSDGRNHVPSIDNDLKGMLSMSPFSSRCCQHNHGMGWPYLAEHLVMGTADGGLATMVYLANETTVHIADGKVTENADSKDDKTLRLSVEGNYPFEEQVTITIHTEASVNFPLYLRVPTWSDHTTVTINGMPIDIKPVAGKYLRLQQTWKNGDRVQLHFPMTIKTRVWQENKGSISIDYGPLTLSLKIDEQYKQRSSSDPEMVQDDSHWQADVDKSLWPAYEIFANSRWNYALELDSIHYHTDTGIQDSTYPLSGFSMSRRLWPADNYPFTPESVPLVFTAEGRTIPNWGIDQTGMTDTLPSYNPTLVHPYPPKTPLHLIPMGAARLRITAFPHSTQE